jgi:hypothetical protein
MCARRLPAGLVFALLCVGWVHPASTGALEGVTTDIGAPLPCTADVRGQVTTGPAPVPRLPEFAPVPLPRLDGYLLADSLETRLFVTPGGEYAVQFDHLGQSLVEAIVPYTLTASAGAAIATAPTWIRMDLEHNLRYLTSAQQDELAGVLLGLDDPRTIDEVAFQIAHLSKNVLIHGYFDPSLMEINAELMYQIDEELLFVDIHDYDLGGGNFYSTTQYRTIVEAETLTVEIPYETYYWWIVMPKVSDEMPLMDASVYNQFWREYLFYEHDAGYPLLQEVMQPIHVLWDGELHDWPGGRPFDAAMLAVDAIGNWCSETVPAAASGNRPIQPNIIAHEHNGNCGELQDLLCAAARTCLIPTLCTMDVLEDHVWCETWLDDWHPYQVDLGRGPTHIDNPGIAYDVDHGGGKEVSCVWDWRNDGFTWDAVARYSDVCTLTVSIDDPDGVPVDNAAVIVASESYYPPYDLYRGTWGETGRTGVIRFLLGDNQNYYVQVNTSLGNYPSSGYALIISNSVAGEHYHWSWTTPSEMPQLAVTEGTPGTDAVYVIEVEYELPFDVQCGRDYYAAPYGWYAEKVPLGTADFFLADETNLSAYFADDPFVAYCVSEDAPTNHVYFHVPSIEDYYVVWSGVEHHGLVTQADVKVRLWVDETLGTPDTPGAPEVARLLRPAPNPFGTVTTVAVDVAVPGEYLLRVYDLGGRFVRTLARGRFESGVHPAVWDGRDDSGRRVASGGYFVELSGKDRREIRRVMLVR